MIAALPLLLVVAWPAGGDVRSAAEAVVSDGVLQTELPGAGAGPAGPRAEAPPREWSRPSPGLEAGRDPMAAVLLWIVVGLTVVAGLVLLGRELLAGAGAARRSPQPAEDAAAVVLPPALLDDAGRLAAEGRFGEAIHVLLLRTFEAIGRARRLPASLTSREVLARAGLPEEARAALADLVGAVEQSRFGGAEPGPEEYRRCAASFERVLAARGGVGR